MLSQTILVAVLAQLAAVNAASTYICASGMTACYWSTIPETTEPSTAPESSATTTEPETSSSATTTEPEASSSATPAPAVSTYVCPKGATACYWSSVEPSTTPEPTEPSTAPESTTTTEPEASSSATPVPDVSTYICPKGATACYWSSVEPSTTPEPTEPSTTPEPSTTTEPETSSSATPVPDVSSYICPDGATACYWSSVEPSTTPEPTEPSTAPEPCTSVTTSSSDIDNKTTTTVSCSDEKKCDSTTTPEPTEPSTSPEPTPEPATSTDVITTCTDSDSIITTVTQSCTDSDKCDKSSVPVPDVVPDNAAGHAVVAGLGSLVGVLAVNMLI
ncbi:unnamed protein product [Ambrosiozyma monospora]|uniref:Unnamed protein product n=1 Tax=Ambrosiozyma monospora TaxID=43982 RepID=A0A9W6Z315_AMBMO|nr:unnamed protein product [Ambrosiozyma monospora]